MGGFPFPAPRRRSPRRGGTRPLFGVGRRQAGPRGAGGMKMRLLMALGIAAFALISYYGNPGDENAVTGKMERVAMAEEEDEIRLGLQAAPQMVQQHGGPSPDDRARARVEAIGGELLAALNRSLQAAGRENPYRFEFTLLADPKTVNAFALPGGQVFITEALYRRLDRQGGNAELAGVLGHEIGHVLERHGNKRMAKQKLFSGLATAGGMAGGDVQSQRTAAMIANMVSMRYGRQDELESDSWGVELLGLAGYDPWAMVGVMKVLDEAGGGGGPPEMLSTHPKPANRIEYIQQVIKARFPDGLPPGLRL